MTKEELFDIADQILTMPYKKDDVLYLANYLMENGRQMMLKNAELQIEVAILKEREACIKIVMQGTGEPIQRKTLDILQQERTRIALAIKEQE